MTVRPTVLAVAGLAAATMGCMGTAHCTGATIVSPEIRVTDAATGRSICDATVVAILGAGADHPLTLAFPEGEYLKGLLLRKVA